MRLTGSRNFSRQTRCLSIIAPHYTLQFREFINHFRGQISFDNPGGLLCHIGICGRHRRDMARQPRDPVNPRLFTAQLVVKGDIGQRLDPKR